MFITKDNLHHIAEAIAFAKNQSASYSTDCVSSNQPARYLAIERAMDELIIQTEDLGYHSSHLLNPSFEKHACWVEVDPSIDMSLFKTHADDDFLLNLSGFERVLTYCLHTYHDLSI